MKEAFIQLETAAKQMGLMINYDGTKHMELSNSPTRENCIIINNHNIENIMEFKYLGSLINNNNSIKAEINHKILLGNRYYYGLRNLLQSRLLNKGTKCKIYKTLIRPVVQYGSESWTLTKADEEKLRTFESSIVRRIYGPTRENGVYRIKYNDELYALYKDLDTVRVTKVARLKMARTFSQNGGKLTLQKDNLAA
jgi:hypothetical protein